jgi:hypothetical protein
MSPDLPAWLESRRPLAVVAAALVGALLLLALTRTFMDRVPLYDEVLHVMAARGVVETGAPVVGSGAYTRGALYTQAVALGFNTLGESLAVARLPALLSGLALVALFAGWVTRRVGLLAGLATGFVLASVPITLSTAVMARFYTMHALAVGILFVCVFEALSPERRPLARGVLAGIALAALAVAWHLQVTTVVAVGALLAGVLALLVLHYWDPLREAAARRPLAAAGVIGAAALAGLVALWVLSSALLAWVGPPPLWAQGAADRPLYYVVQMSGELPMLWPLLPLAVIGAFALDRRLAVFCAAAALAAFVAQSIAPQRATRYLYYAIPWFAVLWGCGLAAFVQLVAAALRTRMAAMTAGVAALAFTGLLIFNSAEGLRTTRLLLGQVPTGELLALEGDWISARRALEHELPQFDRIVASSGMKAMYAFGDYDYELNASVVLETETRSEFGRDRRTGRHVIAAADSLARVLEEPGVTLVVADEGKVGRRAGIPEETVALIASRCRPLDVPANTGVRAWACGAETAATVVAGGS